MPGGDDDDMNMKDPENEKAATSSTSPPTTTTPTPPTRIMSATMATPPSTPTSAITGPRKFDEQIASQEESPSKRIKTGGPEDAEMLEVLSALTEDQVEDLRNGISWRDSHLDADQVKAGKMEELRRLDQFEVKEDIDEKDYKGPTIDTRWVDVPKNGAVRSRIVAVVAKQFAQEAVAEYFAGTPDPIAFRFFLRCLGCDKELVARTIDAVSAFLQAKSEDNFVVRLPKNVRKPGQLWLLKKALPGCLQGQSAVARPPGRGLRGRGRVRPAPTMAPTGASHPQAHREEPEAREPWRRHLLHWLQERCAAVPELHGRELPMQGG